MGTELWAAYVRAVSAEDRRQQDVAARSGMTQATISRWMNGQVVPDKAGDVAAFAKAYGRNVLEAFIAAGMLSEDDAGRGLPKASREYLADLRQRGRDQAVYDAIRQNPQLRKSLRRSVGTGTDRKRQNEQNRGA